MTAFIRNSLLATSVLFVAAVGRPQAQSAAGSRSIPADTTCAKMSHRMGTHDSTKVQHHDSTGKAWKGKCRSVDSLPKQ